MDASLGSGFMVVVLASNVAGKVVEVDALGKATY